MRIAIWHNLGSGGGKRALYHHLKILLEAGHFVESWTTDISSPDYLPLGSLIKETRKPLRSKFEKINKITNPVKRENEKIKLFEDHCIECVKEIEANEFDLIFANSCSVTNMPFIGAFTKLPAIVYLGEPQRNLYEAIPENIWQATYQTLELFNLKKIIGDFRRNLAKRILVFKEIESAKTYKKILVNSLYSRESIIRAYGLDASVCYLGIDTNEFVTYSLKKEPYVVGLGSISFLKSVHKAIEVIGSIPEKKRPTLKWIGNFADKSYLQTVRQLASDLRVNVEFFVDIDDNELKTIVSNAAVMIYTSRLEPFGLAPLEANACGTFVVAIAEGGVRESITNGMNGILINGYKVKEMCEAIVSFTGNLEYASLRGQDARNFVSKNWNVQSMQTNILNEIDSLITEIQKC